MSNENPIEVHASPLLDQLWAGLRQVAPPAVAYAAGRGILQDDTGTFILVLFGVVWPIVAGQLKTRRRATELATVTASAPDHVAVLK
jgi:hypothetical protein